MSNYEFWIELGNIYKAINAYQEKAIEFNKRFIFPWIRLGNIFDKQSRSEDAIKAYQKAIELDPQNANVWNEIGNVHLKAGDYAQAEAAYLKAMEYDPASGWPCSNLGLSYFRQARYADAIPLFQKSIELLQDDKSKAASWNRLGDTYQRLDDRVNAISAYQKADSLDPNSSALRIDSGEGMDEPGVFSESTINETVESDVPVMPASLVDQIPTDTGGEVLVEAGAAAEDGAGMPQSIDPLAIEAPAKEDVAVEQIASADAVQESAFTEATKPEQIVSLAIEEVVLAEEPVVESTTPEEKLELPEAVGTSDEPRDAVDLPVEDGNAIPALLEAQADPQALLETPAAPLPEVEIITDENSTIDTSAPVALAEAVTVVVIAPEKEEAQPEVIAPEGSQTPVDKVEGGVTQATAKEEPSVDVPVEEPVLQAIESISNDEITEKQPADQATPVSMETPGTAVVESAMVESSAAPAGNTEPEAQQVTPLAIVNAIINADVKSAHVWNELGNIYISIGAYDQAIDVYHKAIELDPEFGWPYSNLALTYFSQGNYTEAIPLYQKSIELLGGNKDKATSWNRLGNAYRSLNNIENAAKAYKNAAALDPDNKSFVKNAAELIPASGPASIEEPVSEEVRGSSNNSAANQVEPAVQVEEPKAVVEETHEVASESAPITPEVISASPETDTKPEEALSLEAAPVEGKAETVDGAAVVLETAPEVVAQASDPEINIEAPIELVEPGDKPQAITIIEEKSEEAIIAAESPSVQSNPDVIVSENLKNESSGDTDTKSAHIWNDLGRTYYNKGNFDDAIYAYKKAIDFDPEFGRPYGNLAGIYLRQGLYAEAIPLYQRSVELLESDNEKATSWNKLGNAYRRLGDYDKAIAAYHMADELDPVNSRMPVQSPFNAMRTSFAQHGTPAVG